MSRRCAASPDRSQLRVWQGDDVRSRTSDGDGILELDENEKVCPYCAETIKLAAIKCKHCGEFMEQTAGLGTPIDVVEWATATDSTVSQSETGAPVTPKSEAEADDLPVVIHSTIETRPPTNPNQDRWDSGHPADGRRWYRLIAWAILATGVALMITGLSIMASSTAYDPSDDLDPGAPFFVWGFVISFVSALYLYYTSDSGKAAAKRMIEKTAAKKRQRVVTSVSCPSCGKNQCERVSPGERATSGLAGGLVFSRKARAQFRCQICKYYW